MKRRDMAAENRRLSRPDGRTGHRRGEKAISRPRRRRSMRSKMLPGFNQQNRQPLFAPSKMWEFGTG